MDGDGISNYNSAATNTNRISYDYNSNKAFGNQTKDLLMMDDIMS